MKASRVAVLAAIVAVAPIMWSPVAQAAAPHHHRPDADGLRVSAVGGGSLTPLASAPHAGLIVSATGGGPLTPLAPPKHPVGATTAAVASSDTDGRPGAGLIAALAIAGAAIALAAMRRRRRARIAVA
jgi:hypothetical protein